MIIDRQRITISVLILVVLLGGYLFISRSSRATYRELELEYAKLYQRVLKERELVKNYEILKARRDSLLKVYEQQLTLMPETEDMTEFLDEVATYGARSGVEFLLFRPMPPVSKGFYQEYPIDMKVTGTFHQLGNFLSLIANAPRLITVENLEILSLQRGEQSQENTLYTVTAQFTLKTYAFTKTAQQASSSATPVVQGGKTP